MVSHLAEAVEETDPLHRSTSRAALLTATYDCILDRGLSGTSVAEVSRRAGVSRMTAYRHFRDLNALIAAVLTDQFGRVMRESATAASDAPTQADYIASLATATTRAILDHPLFTAVIDSEPNILLPLVHERFGATQQLAIGLLRDAIGRAVATPDDQTVQVDNPDFAAISVVLICQSFAFSRHAYDEVMKPADADAQLHHVIRSFIGTPR